MPSLHLNAISFILLITLLLYDAYGQSVPPGISYYREITITNSQAAPVPSNSQVMIPFNAFYDYLYTSNEYLAPDLANIEFFNLSNGNVINSWLEGNTLNGYQGTNLYTSENIVYWVTLPGLQNDPGNAIEASNTLKIGIGYSSVSNNLLSNTLDGVAPQLWCASGCPQSSYGEYDDGKSVFKFYDNFAGNSISSAWNTVTTSSLLVDNGISFTGAGSGGNNAQIVLTQAYQRPFTIDFFAYSSGSNPTVSLGYVNGYGSAFSSGYQSTQGPVCSANTAILKWSGSSSSCLATSQGANPVTSYGITSFYIGNSKLILAYNYTENIISTIDTSYNSYYPMASSWWNDKTIHIQWFRIRSYPPAGVMPTTLFGNLISTSPSYVPPIIAQPQPAQQTADQGQTVTISDQGAELGTTPYSYQWIAEAPSQSSYTASEANALCATPQSTSCSFASNSAVAAGTYSFELQITDAHPTTATSTQSNVVLNSEVVANPITPTSPQIKTGGNVVLTANPSGGSGTYTYQWYSGTSSTCSSDTAIAGATSSTYTASPTQDTYYCYQSTDQLGESATSTTDNVIVLQPILPVIAVSNTMVLGSSGQITFNAIIRPTTAPYTYNFVVFNAKTGVPVANILNSNVQSTSNTFVWSPPSSIDSNSVSYFANVTVTDSQPTPQSNYTYSGNIFVIGSWETPPGIIQYKNITVSNWHENGTSQAFQLMVAVNALSNYTLLNSSLSNVEFFDGVNGTILNSWLEGNALNETQSRLISSSTDVVFWVRLPWDLSAGVPNVFPSNSIIGMGFAHTNKDLFNGNTIGAAPQLFCASGCPATSYGGVDNGANVFDVYGAFQGSSMPNSWSLAGSASFSGSSNGIKLVSSNDNGGSAYTAANLINTITEASYYFNSSADRSETIYGAYATGFISYSSSNYYSLNYGMYSGADETALINSGTQVASGTNINKSYIYLYTQSAITKNLIQMNETTSSSQIYQTLSNTNILSYPGIISAQANTLALYAGVGAASITSINLLWALVRTYPPSGVMPSLNFSQSQLTGLIMQANSISYGANDIISFTPGTSTDGSNILIDNVQVASSASGQSQYIVCSYPASEQDCLPAGNHVIDGCDTTTNACSQAQTLSINSIAPQLQFTGKCAKQVPYTGAGCVTSASIYALSNQIQANLYQNGVLVANTFSSLSSTSPNSVGTYSYTFNTLGNGNYLPNSISYSFNIIAQPQAPPGVLYYVPITITNFQNLQTPNPFQSMIAVNSLNYSEREAPNLDNIEFFYQNGTIINSWMEGSASNSLLDNPTNSVYLYTSTNTIYWANTISIPANSSLIVYMGFTSNTENILGQESTGEAPQLSATYGEYDDGANVFYIYGAFQGNSMPQGWTTKSIVGSYAPTFIGGQSSSGGVEMMNNGGSQATALQYNYPFTFSNVIVEASYMFNGNADDMGFGIYASGISSSSGGGSPASINGYYASYEFYSGASPLLHDSTTTYASASSQVLPTSGTNFMFVQIPVTTSETKMNFTTSTANIYESGIYSGLSTAVSYSGSPISPGNIFYVGSATGGATAYMYLYWIRARSYPPEGIMPSISFSEIQQTSMGVSISSPSNSITYSGNYESFTATVSGGTQPYTYNFLVFNSADTSAITHNDLVSTSAGAYTFSFQANSLDVSNSPEEASVEVTDSKGNTANSISQQFKIYSSKIIASISSNPALPSSLDVGQTETFTASATGGTGTYVSYNFTIYNSATGMPVANQLSTNPSFSYTIPSSQSGNYLYANVLVTDTSGQVSSSPSTGVLSVDPALSVSISSSPSLPALLNPGQVETFTAVATGGSGSYTSFNFIVYNSVTNAVVANQLTSAPPSKCGNILPSNIATLTLYCIPINIINPSSVATPTNTQLMLAFNALAYSSYLSNSLQNIYIYNGISGLQIPAWIEGNSSNEYQTSNINLASNVVLWINLGTDTLPGGSSANGIYYFGIGSTSTNFLVPGNNIGEAPQLSNAYGEYDNGNSVFINYWNFEGQNLPQTLIANTIGGASESVSNGLTITESSTNSGEWITYPISSQNTLTEALWRSLPTATVGATGYEFSIGATNSLSQQSSLNTGPNGCAFTVLPTFSGLTLTQEAGGLSWCLWVNGYEYQDISATSGSTASTTNAILSSQFSPQGTSVYHNYTSITSTASPLPTNVYPAVGVWNSGSGPNVGLISWLRVRTYPDGSDASALTGNVYVAHVASNEFKYTIPSAEAGNTLYAKVFASDTNGAQAISAPTGILTVNSPLVVEIISYPSLPSSFDVGQSATLSALASGGSLTYESYNFLVFNSITGILVGNYLTTTNSFTYTIPTSQVGNTLVFNVLVTDSAGDASNSAETGTLSADPALHAYIASYPSLPTTLNVGQSISFNALASGGSGTYLSYNFLIYNSITGILVGNFLSPANSFAYIIPASQSGNTLYAIISLTDSNLDISNSAASGVLSVSLLSPTTTASGPPSQCYYSCASSSTTTGTTSIPAPTTTYLTTSVSTTIKTTTTTAPTTSVQTTTTAIPVIINPLPPIGSTVSQAEIRSYASSKAPAIINFTNARLLLKIFIASEKPLESNFTVSNITGRVVAPPGVYTITAVNVSSTTPISNIFAEVKYPCSLPPESIAPYVPENGIWIALKNYTINQSSCTVYVHTNNTGPIAIFSTSQPGIPAIYIYAVLSAISAIIAIYALRLRGRRQKIQAPNQQQAK